MTNEENARLFLIEKYGLREDLEIWRIKQDEELSREFFAYIAGAKDLEDKEEQLARILNGAFNITQNHMNTFCNIETNEAALEYIIHSVIFRHDHDKSCEITQEAKEHEVKLFKDALLWLKQFDKENKILVSAEALKEKCK